MVIQPDANIKGVFIRFSEDEWDAMLAAACVLDKTLKDVLDELLRIGFNQVVIGD